MENKNQERRNGVSSYQNRAKKYAEALLQVKGLLEDADNPVGVLANVAAVLKETFSYYWWVGFYVVRHDRLLLGPFQGPMACLSIGRGRGVCGTSWAEARTLIVPGVEQFPGHIACSSRSRSEIVVPIIKRGEVVAVIDVDSAELDAFHEADEKGLVDIAKAIAGLFPYQ